MASSPLLMLPLEVVQQVADLVHPSALVSFASACKQTLRCCQRQLERRKQLDEKYRAVEYHFSIRQSPPDHRLAGPYIVPQLIKCAFQDPEGEIWHLRRVTFLRAAHGGLSPYLNKPLAELAIQFTDGNDDIFETPSAEDFPPNRMLSHFRDSLGISFELAHRFIFAMQNGYRQPLEVLLMALAPRLQTADLPHSALGDDSGFAVPEPSIIAVILLAVVEDLVKHKPNPAWPPGFQSLRKVSLSRETIPQSFVSDDDCLAKPSEVAALFRLPSIKVLILGMLNFYEKPADNFPASSTVAVLEFTLKNSVTALAMIKCAKQLRRLSYHGPFCKIMDDLESIRVKDMHMKETLEELQWVDLRIDDDIRLMSHHTVDFTRFSCLTKIGTLPVAALLSRAVNIDGPDNLIVHQGWLGSWVLCVMQELTAILPKSLRTVRLGCSLPMDQGDTLLPWDTMVKDNPNVARLLLHNVVRLAEHRAFKNLREVCLVPVTGLPEFEWDESAYSRIVARNVNVHRPAHHGVITRQEYVRDELMHNALTYGNEELANDPRTDPRNYQPPEGSCLFDEVDLDGYWP